jgi:hypothetical protein
MIAQNVHKRAGVLAIRSVQLPVAEPSMTRSPEQRLIAIQDALTARCARRALFPTHLFDDAAWDVLLELYAAALQEEECGLDALSIAGLSAKRLLNLLDQLKGEGLMTEIQGANPARFRLTISGLSRMECFFSSPIDLSHC